jgi:uncharacterized protein (DUF2147 family)
MRTLLLALFFTAITAPAFAAPSPLEGLWLTQNKRVVVNIESCDWEGENSLCGTVYWVIKGGLQTDLRNPDPALRSRPMCGLMLMWGFEQDNLHEWENGEIYKADDGDMYEADLELLEDDRLEVRGYLGISWFGRTQIWTRADATLYPPCKSKV